MANGGFIYKGRVDWHLTTNTMAGWEAQFQAILNKLYTFDGWSEHVALTRIVDGGTYKSASYSTAVYDNGVDAPSYLIMIFSTASSSTTQIIRQRDQQFLRRRPLTISCGRPISLPESPTQPADLNRQTGLQPMWF